MIPVSVARYSAGNDAEEYDTELPPKHSVAAFFVEDDSVESITIVRCDSVTTYYRGVTR